VQGYYLVLSLLIARLLLSAVFAIAGIAKLADPSGSRRSLTDFGMPRVLLRPVALLLPFGELACAVALIPISSAWWGAAGVLALLLLFSTGVGVSLARGRKPDCHCFGQLHSEPIGWDTLVRNLALAGIAGFVLWQGGEKPGLNLLSWLAGVSRSPTAMPALAAAFVVLVVFDLWVLFHLMRQNGRLLLRLEAAEGKTAAGQEPKPPGLPVGSPAPGFSLNDLEGNTSTLDALRLKGKPLLLIFSEPGCGACEGMLPDLALWQRERVDRLLIVPISRGDVKSNRAKFAPHGIRNVLLQSDRETANAYQSKAVPSAVVVRDGIIDSPLAVGPDALRSLVSVASLPPPVKKGGLVPSLRLPDLTGSTFDLSERGNRRTLLLFWNPSCGYCQQMLQDVKNWERDSASDGLELLVVSSGSLEAALAQGFQSRVLLDPGFGVGKVFGVSGTPSAVLVDEQGRVASEVSVGAQSVLALAGAIPAGSAGRS
jgi:thiol-disulfide isomerase/thioredoxin/uncharacterized membrane protein YphA (DoxX/SURF4 family)